MANTLITQLENPAVLQLTSKRLANVISVLLSVACAYLLVEITWLFFAPDEQGVSVSQKKSARSNTLAQQTNFRQLTAANVFGVSDRVVVPQQQKKTPVTRLNLTLKGVLAAIPMKLANAIIAQGRSGKEENYSVGEKVSNGVLLKEIHPDHVVLERNGRDEILKLQKESGIAGIEQSRSNSRYNARAQKASPAAALKSIRTNILKDPTSFGQYALPVVVKKNGKQIGYRLKPQQKGELLAELGIQASDVIIRINGVKLDKPQNGISALRKLSTAKNLDIVVMRNGAEVPINISL